MFLASMPSVIKKAFPSLIWRMNNEDKVIHLTFDDGPIPETTRWILKTLDNFNAKATFFCVGDNVEKYPHLYNQILDKDHVVGNHTFNHLSGWKTETSDYVENIYKAENLISSDLFRPPHGLLKNSQIQALKNNFKIIMWDVLSMDYEEKISPLQCLKNVTNNAKNGSIIVFHDSIKAWKNLQYALPKTLEYFSELGYSFNSINLNKYQLPKPSIIESWMNSSYSRQLAS
ncbi:MAG: polysaccharide deacetylase family protein [Bacteroidales bacterium]|nr:polysaccharide deacetylase family protein [Bacteroidales bacterium]MBN2756130.1 polysaccharide deacetylase family protein [Bacteroidales bacterium]